MSRLAARLGVAVAVLVAVAGAPDVRAAATEPHPCTQLALSPAFATDGTALCAGLVWSNTGQTTGAAVFLTTDKGRSWRKTAAAGLVQATDDSLWDVFFSPRYPADRMIFVQISRRGLFVTTDGGETFALVVPFGYGRFTPYVEASAGLPGAERTMLAHAHSEPAFELTEVVDPATHLVAPVTGTPGDDKQFGVSPRYATDRLAVAAAMVEDPVDSTRANVAIFACSAQFTCTEERLRSRPYVQFDELRVLPAATPSGFMVVVRLLIGSRQEMWRSTDGGRTYSPWSSVNRIANTVTPAHGGNFRVAVAGDPAQPRRMFLRLSWTGLPPNRPAPPSEQVFVSENGGSTWKLLSFNRINAQLDRVGAIPETAGGGSPLRTPRNFIAAGGGGRLFILAGDVGYLPGTYTGPYCSRDGGRTWAKFC